MTDKLTVSYDYTDAEILAILREALLRVAVAGQSYQMNIGGGTRLLTRANIKELQALIEDYERRVDLASGQSPVNYARFTRG